MSPSNTFEAMTPEPTRLRQIALVAEDLDRARHLLMTVLGTEVIREDPAVAQWGLRNILVPIGSDIIEVVSPFRASTPASRHLSKRGDSGYMIIMQTQSALTRQAYIEINKLGKVIFKHQTEESVCIQYHPRGVAGGMIPELDSQFPCEEYPEPLIEGFGPWHAVGSKDGWEVYGEKMRRHGDLQLMGVTLRLKPGDGNINAAAKQWEDAFGVQRGEEGEVRFTNAKMRFVPGEGGENEGLVEMVIGLEGRERLQRILEAAEKEGLKVRSGGSFHMLGTRWKLVLLDSSEAGARSRL